MTIFDCLHADRTTVSFSPLFIFLLPPFSLCVSIWTPNQVEWPRPIRSELPKHAVHDEWLGTFLMISIIESVDSISRYERGFPLTQYYHAF